MSSASQAFEENNGTSPLRKLKGGVVAASAAVRLPWQKVPDGQMPPLMFQLRMNDGVHESFPYGDIRRIRCRDAGSVQLETFSSPRTIITIEGRHLRELAALLCIGMIQWIEESDTRDVDRDEQLPTVTRIRVELSTSS